MNHLANCSCNGSSHFQHAPVASTEKENLDSEAIDGIRSMNGAVASSTTNHDEETNEGGEKEKHCSSEIEAAVRSAEQNEEEEEKERLRELGNLIGSENLKALLDAEAGRRGDGDAYQGPSRWRRRRRSGQKKVLTSEDQIQVQQQPLDLPLDKAEVVKKQEKLPNRVKTTGEDNLVLRKLLRRPRYFDPPTDGLLEKLCPYCGKEGHMAKLCALRNEKKPCFLCGSFDHTWKDCGQSLCEDESCHLEEGDNLNSEICLRCRESGHNMLSCKSDYPPDDLKEVECYLCKKVGHLCCSEFPDVGPLEVSCYRCGGSGHLGSGCTEESMVKHQKKSRFRARYRKRKLEAI